MYFGGSISSFCKHRDESSRLDLPIKSSNKERRKIVTSRLVSILPIFSFFSLQNTSTEKYTEHMGESFDRLVQIEGEKKNMPFNHLVYTR